MSVVLAANALIDEADLATYMGAGPALNVDDARRVINRASDMAQSFLRRNLITPAADVVEFHTLAGPDADLFLLDFPIVSVTSVHEDATRTYGVDALLAADQYIISKPGGKLVRCEPNAGLESWMPGARAIRVAYKYGWTRTALPERFKDFAGQLAALLWAEKKRGTVGATGQSDSMGNYTRITASHLPDWLIEPVQNEQAPIGDKTGERDE